MSDSRDNPRDPKEPRSKGVLPEREGSIPLPKPPSWMTGPSEELPPLPDLPRPLAPILPEPAELPRSISRPKTERPAEAPAAPPKPEPVTSAAIPEVQGIHLAPLVEAAGESAPVVPAEAEQETLQETEIAPPEEEIYPDDEPLLTIDPLFAYLVLAVVTLIGLGNFAPEARYTLVWSGLVLVGVAGLIVDQHPVERPAFRDLLVGAGYGLLVGVPILLVGAPQLRRLSLDIFGQATDTAVFQALAFVMPLAETLFFRGAFQAARGVVPSALAGGLWPVILFLPALDVIHFPLVAIFIGLVFIALSFLYSYLAERLNLFSAWACQVVISVLLLWVARLIG